MIIYHSAAMLWQIGLVHYISGIQPNPKLQHACGMQASIDPLTHHYTPDFNGFTTIAVLTALSIFEPVKISTKLFPIRYR